MPKVNLIFYFVIEKMQPEITSANISSLIIATNLEVPILGRQAAGHF